MCVCGTLPSWGGTHPPHLAEVDEVILDVSGQGLNYTREPIQYDTQVGYGRRVCPRGREVV